MSFSITRSLVQGSVKYAKKYKEVLCETKACGNNISPNNNSELSLGQRQGEGRNMIQISNFPPLFNWENPSKSINGM